MKRYDLGVSPREQTGTGPNRRLRVEGKIPAVIYGAGSEPEKVTIEYREFEKLMSRADAKNGLINLKSESSGDAVAILREIQRDPLTRRYLHLDLYRIRMDQENDFEVAIHSQGVPVGVREGGLLETHLRAVTVRCLPAKLPDSINVDITDLKLLHSLHVSDLTLPDDVVMVTNPEETICTVIALRVEVAAPTEEVAPETPEVIGKKKPEEADDKAKETKETKETKGSKK